jgi:anti-sigma B factor antagonist
MEPQEPDWDAELRERRDDSATLTVSGELDLATAPRLRATVGDLMGQGVRHLEIDLDGVTFIDSSGMGALLWAWNRLDAAGGELHAVHVHGAAARALELAGIDRQLAVST